MKLIHPSHEILFIQPKILKTIEAAGRTCYKSENKITDTSAEKFVEMVVKRGHHSVIEHANITVRFICDRGVSHELVRHRLAAYSQESTRYCDYRGGITFIIPPWVTYSPDEVLIIDGEIKGHSMDYCPAAAWFDVMLEIECKYIELITAGGWSPQQARSILPNSLKTEIVMTANVREWIHVLKLRTSKRAHPQMRELMLPLLNDLKEKVPVIFNDI